MEVVSYLLGKKAGGGSGTSDYSALTNKPSINGVTLSGDKTSEDLGLPKNIEITIDMQNRLREETLQEVSEFITQNVGNVVNINVVDGTVFQSSGSIFVQETINNFTPSTDSILAFGVTYTTATIQGSWSNGEYTASAIVYADLGALKTLSTTNTTAFTPTGNYQPANKKYVDDSIASAIGAALGGSY